MQEKGRELNNGGRNDEMTEFPHEKEAQEVWGSLWEKKNTRKMLNGLKIS